MVPAGSWHVWHIRWNPFSRTHSEAVAFVFQRLINLSLGCIHMQARIHGVWDTGQDWRDCQPALCPHQEDGLSWRGHLPRKRARGLAGLTTSTPTLPPPALQFLRWNAISPALLCPLSTCGGEFAVSARLGHGAQILFWQFL